MSPVELDRVTHATEVQESHGNTAAPRCSTAPAGTAAAVNTPFPEIIRERQCNWKCAFARALFNNLQLKYDLRGAAAGTRGTSPYFKCTDVTA